MQSWRGRSTPDGWIKTPDGYCGINKIKLKIGKKVWDRLVEKTQEWMSETNEKVICNYNVWKAHSQCRMEIRKVRITIVFQVNQQAFPIGVCKQYTM